MSSTWIWLGGLGAGSALIALAWWGWHQGGLALLQLGMATC
ncbi:MULTISPECIES: hypothetical protein [Pseudomonas]|nr:MULTISPECIES: hypothetical protein [Pseudomonas]